VLDNIYAKGKKSTGRRGRDHRDWTCTTLRDITGPGKVARANTKADAQAHVCFEKSRMQGAPRIVDARFLFHLVSFWQAIVCGEAVPVASNL